MHIGLLAPNSKFSSFVCTTQRYRNLRLVTSCHSLASVFYWNKNHNKFCECKIYKNRDRCKMDRIMFPIYDITLQTCLARVWHEDTHALALGKQGLNILHISSPCQSVVQYSMAHNNMKKNSIKIPFFIPFILTFS